MALQTNKKKRTPSGRFVAKTVWVNLPELSIPLPPLTTHSQQKFTPQGRGSLKRNHPNSFFPHAEPYPPQSRTQTR